MSFYETVFIARQDLSTQQIEALTESYLNLLKEQGAKVEVQEYWGLRTLSYPIKKNARGHYVMLRMKASVPAINELNRQMGLNENVLRSLTLKVDTLDTEPSIMMRPPKERERRDYSTDEVEAV